MHVMQPLDVSIFAPLKAAYKRLVTELASHVPGTGIDKAAFGSLYLQARGTALTSAKAKKAFKDSGIMVSPSPDKVLGWLAGSAARHRSDSPQPVPVEEVTVPRLEAEMSSMLDCFRNASDPRTARGLKRSLLQAFQAPQAELMVACTQETRRTVVETRSRRPIVSGDRAVLSRDRMISQEYAERELIGREAEFAQCLQEEDRQEEDSEAASDFAATDDNDEEHDVDEESILAAFMATTRPQMRTYQRSQCRTQLLNAVKDTNADTDNLYGSVPVASSSRNKL